MYAGLLTFLSRERMVVMENRKEKKSIFKRAKDYWNSLDRESKNWLAALGIWTVDGFIFGSAITSIFAAKRTNKLVKQETVAAYLTGLHDGEVSAYQNVVKSMQATNGINKQH